MPKYDDSHHPGLSVNQESYFLTMIKPFAMKKIQSAVTGLFLIPCFLFISGRMTAQDNVKGINCSLSSLKAIQGSNQNGCYFDMQVILDYDTVGMVPQACPHGINVSLTGATIVKTEFLASGTSFPQPWPPGTITGSSLNWFTSSSTIQYPNPVTDLTTSVCWSRICNPNASNPFLNILPPKIEFELRIYVKPDPSAVKILVSLKTIQGYAWVSPAASPGCNVFDCHKEFTFDKPSKDYIIECTESSSTINCNICLPPETYRNLHLNLPVPSGSTVVWYNRPYQLSPPPPPPAAGWNFFSQSSGPDCLTPLMNVSTYWAAVVTTGCYSYPSRVKLITVCHSNTGIGTTATNNLYYPVLKLVDGKPHACSPWMGTINLTGQNITCPTTITWQRKGGSFGPGWSSVPSSNGLTQIPTGSLNYVYESQNPCYAIYSFKVTLTNTSSVCPQVSSTIDIYIDKATTAGSISAYSLETGIGTTGAPVFCDSGYTSISYAGACTKVDHWEKSENADPCGTGNIWQDWTLIPNAPTGDNTTYATNELFRTTRFRTQVYNYACDTVPSESLIVRIIPPLSVTVAANSPCPDVCNMPVSLSASVPCSTAYAALTYMWYRNGAPVTGIPPGNTFSPSQGGDYYVVVSTGTCGTKQSNTISVCGAPGVSISGPCAICCGQTATLQANVEGCSCQTVTYLWSTGATTPVIVVNLPGVYGVTVTTGNCQVSASTVLDQCPSSVSGPFPCGDSITINHLVSGGVAPVNKTVTYQTVANIPGEPLKCWITRNLGASHQAAAVNDVSEASAGWYWQFNRRQGFQFINSRIPNTTWITTINENLGWQAANDPCFLELGCGWRIPTATEWTNVDAAGNWQGWSGPWNSALRMHAAGALNGNDGSIHGRGVYGNYYSNTASALTAAWLMNFFDNHSAVDSDIKTWADPLRCITE